MFGIRPKPGMKLLLNGSVYTFLPRRTTPKYVDAAEARQATTYKMRNSRNELFALKVFKPAHRDIARARMPQVHRVLSQFGHLPAMKICAFEVVTSQGNDAVRLYPELENAMLMPWIKGDLWLKILLDRQALTLRQSIALAKHLSHSLARLEEFGLAHCDLANKNVKIRHRYDRTYLLDVEDMYHEDLPIPYPKPTGSAGYQHRFLNGLWNEHGDRFAGAILLSEILCWHDEAVRASSYGESYFEADDLQKDSSYRYQTISAGLARLQDKAGGRRTLVRLLKRAWESDKPQDCPTLREWRGEISALYDAHKG